MKYFPTNAEDLSVSATISLDDSLFQFSVEVPSARRYQSGKQIWERLRESRNGGEFLDVCYREGEEIQIGGRPNTIRVSPFFPAMMGLYAILPTDDPVRSVLWRVISFFGGISYYSLGDALATVDFVPENAYQQWREMFRATGFPSDSVGLRLIYMWKEAPEMFEEFRQLTGPMGLDLIRRVDVNEIDAPRSPADVVQPATGAAKAEKHYWVSFEPAAHMGGTGSSVFLSSLSLGTRRSIRAIVSLLFDKRSVMLIEHPEDTIHPGLVRKLVDTLRSYSESSQIIFTTHSPEVLDVLRPEEVLLVSAANGQTSVRGLNGEEVLAAKRFLKDEGSLSEYIHLSDD